MHRRIEVVEAVPFTKDLKKLAKKYRHAADLAVLVSKLVDGETSGDRIPGTEYVIYKERLPNTSANRGEQGGFRVIYYVQLQDRIVLLTYSKIDHADVPVEVIRRIVKEHLDAELPEE
ncbi:MAG: addiction module antitoxin [Anaerolinea sp.]|nr:addiction module antitoxin [Anaerolinea sp.]